MILEKIIAAKKEEVAHIRRMNSLSELKAAIRDLPSPRDFSGAISGQLSAIIAEIKKCSPSKGLLRKDFDYLQIASIYQESGASAVSVLTDQQFFGGDIGYLSDIKKIIRLPLLRKDFIIDTYQIYETRVIGGDALLLIAGILNGKQLREFVDLSETLGLFPLVEVHSRSELDKALVSGATIIGINNRDLDTFSTDLGVSLNLAPHVPTDRILISESGIHTRRDIENLLSAGIHAFLIGETLMRAENMGRKMNELLGRNQ
jgi:indole-3-glycerol phosphate synthase